MSNCAVLTRPEPACRALLSTLSSALFGVFFAADMAGFTAEMWRLVRPGGVLAITTWGPDLFEPGQQPFLGVSPPGRAVTVPGVQPVG